MTETTKHPTKALVLDGGGITAAAWELGLIVGLHDGGAEVTDADVVVGTSAGAIVGAQMSSGLRLEELYALQLKPVEGTREAIVPPDLAELRRVMAAGREAADPQTGRAHIPTDCATRCTSPGMPLQAHSGARALFWRGISTTSAL